MMPMPPDQQRDAGDGREQQCHHFGGALRGLRQIRLIANREVIRLVGRQPVRARAGSPRISSSADGMSSLRAVLARICGMKLRPERRVWTVVYGESIDVVLIPAFGGLALRRHDADHLHRHIADADRLTDRILLGKQVVSHRAAQHRHLAQGAHLGLHRRSGRTPRSSRGSRGSRATRRSPSVRQLPAPPIDLRGRQYHRRHGGEPYALALDRLGVPESEPVGGACALIHAALLAGARV